MSNVVGADIGELRELAATFNAKAMQLKSIENQLSWRIHAAPWHGHDVDRFEQDWDTRHRRAILSAAATISTAAKELMANAEQQELASAAGNIAGIPSVAFLRAQELNRISGASGAGPAVAIGAGGLSALALLKGIRSAAHSGIGIAKKYMEFSHKSALKARVIAQFGEEHGKKLLSYVPAALARNNSLYKTLNSVDGKFLGPVGVALDVWSLKENLQKHEYDAAVISGGSAALGVGTTLVALGVISGPAAPVILAAAAVWAVGSLAYEHREALIKAGSWVAEQASERARQLSEAANRLAEQASRAVGDAADKATQAIRRITNPLRSVFG